VNYAVVVLDSGYRVRYVNRACERLVGRGRQRILGDLATGALPELFGQGFIRYREVHGLAQPGCFDEYHAALDMWTESHACPSPSGLLVCSRDVSAQKRNERVLAGQARVLEMVAASAPLEKVLHAITALVEQQSRQDLCSILLLSDGRLTVAAAASFPADYNAAIDGCEIGPAVGSCGTAASMGRLVVTPDIAADPRWAGYEELALRHGLRACWSRPILSRDGLRVVGTVANYSRKVGQPTDQSLRLLDTAAHLAQIAIGQAEDDAERNATAKLLATEAAVTRVLAGAGSAREAIPRLLEAICITCDWETGAYWVVDEAAEVIRCATFWRQGRIDVEDFERLSLYTALASGAGLPGRVWATARPTWINNLHEDSNFPRRAAAIRHGLRGALGFPVMREGRVVGVMEFFARDIRPSDPNLDAMLTVLGGQVGQFLHRVQAEGQLKAAKEQLQSALREGTQAATAPRQR
jgi:GAF domain-containing protein